MKLIINAGSTFDGGAIQVALSFIQECRKISENNYYVILSQKLATYIDETEYPQNFKFYYLDYRPASRVFSFKNRTNFFKKIENEVKPDVVFTTSGPAYWKPNAPHLCGFNIPQSIYRESRYFKDLDLKSQWKWKFDKYFRRYFFRLESKHFVVQTADVNSRLRLWFRTENVYTVSNTCHSVYRNPIKVEDKLPQKQTGEFRFLTFSTFRGHKNFNLIKQVVDSLDISFRSKIKFVITIPQVNYDNFFGNNYQDIVYNVGPISVNEGPSLYLECDAVFQPTVLECFSATYPEAMAVKLPILTSDLSFARSICGDAAEYFDPYEPNDAILIIKKLIDSKELQDTLISNGTVRLSQFGDGLVRAKKYLQLCEKIMKKQK